MLGATKLVGQVSLATGLASSRASLASSPWQAVTLASSHTGNQPLTHLSHRCSRPLEIDSQPDNERYDREWVLWTASGRIC